MIARFSAAAEMDIPRPPLSERWFSDLCFDLMVYASPMIAITLARREHEYEFLLLQSAVVALICAYTVLRLRKRHSPLWVYILILPIAVLAGLLATNKIWLFPYGG